MKKGRLSLFGLLAAAILILNHHFHWSETLAGQDMLLALKSLAEHNLWQAALIYMAITVACCVLLALPGATFALFAGILFGPWLGILLCLLATTLGASASFLVGRFFLRDFFRSLAEKNRYLKRFLFDAAPKNEALMLMVTRLVPLFPYNLQNFAYGITSISFWSYTWYTFVFMIPGVSLFTIGAAGLTVQEGRGLYFLAAGALLVAVLGAGGLLKRRYLTERTEKNG